MARTPVHRFPTTFRQEHWLRSPPSGHSTDSLVIGLRFDGPFDERALKTALDDLVARHEILRTTFAPSDPPQQHVAAAGQLPLERLTVPAPACAGADPLVDAMVEERMLPFALWGAPLARATLTRTAPEQHAVWLTLHHAAVDGWSLRVLARDLARLYEAAVTGVDAQLPPIRLGMGDLATWERGDHQAKLRHWRDLLERRRSTGRIGVEGRALPHRVSMHDRAIASTATAERLSALTASSGTSMSAVLSAALAAAFSRWRTHEVVVGQMRSNRGLPDLRLVVGLVSDVVPVPIDVSGDPPFALLVERAHRAERTARAHQVPFGVLSQALGDDGTRRTPAVVDALLNYQPMAPSLPVRTRRDQHATRIAEVTVPSARLVWAAEPADACFPLIFRIVADAQGLTGELQLDAACAAEPGRHGIEGELVHMLAAAARDPSVRLSRLRERA